MFSLFSLLFWVPSSASASTNNESESKKLFNSNSQRKTVKGKKSSTTTTEDETSNYAMGIVKMNRKETKACQRKETRPNSIEKLVRYFCHVL